MAKVVDKYSFKEYIASKLTGGCDYVAPTFGVWDSINDLEKEWDSLPQEFVLKSTISSDGTNIIFVKDKSSIAFSKIRNEVCKWFKSKHTQLNGYSLPYYTIRPRVFAEKYLHELDGVDGLNDYKFYCFNGTVQVVYTTSRVFEGNDPIEEPSRH